MGKWKQVQKYASHIPSPIEHLKRNILSASRVLILDATFVQVAGRDRAIHIAYDTGLGVVDYCIGKKETKKSYSYIFERLKKVGYRPICAVSDGNVGLVASIQKNGWPHQRCIVHLLRELVRLLGELRVADLKRKNREIYFLIHDIWMTKTIEEIPQKFSDFQKHEHRFKNKAWILEWFKEKSVAALMHLSFAEKIPRTSNAIENLNGQIKQRIKTMRGMKSAESLFNLLKIFFYFKNYK